MNTMVLWFKTKGWALKKAYALRTDGWTVRFASRVILSEEIISDNEDTYVLICHR